jgi:CRISPR-associated RAMP protein (TIGR02581 family)
VLKRRLCEASFTWKLKCDGPLLIADGRYDKKDKKKDRGGGERGEKSFLPNKVFISHQGQDEIQRAVETQKPEHLRLDFYVPGTSLRGPFRAQAERIIRSLVPEDVQPPLSACDPFRSDAAAPEVPSCSKRLSDHPVTVPYAVACPACRLFGCTATASRIQFDDAAVQKYKSVYRDMIGIDRFTGGVYQGEKTEGQDKGGGANMRLHVLEETAFETTILVRNFELWQLGLLAYVFRDFEEGLVPIGFGKSKGFGQVKGSVEKVTLTYPAGRCDGLKVEHLGSLCHEPVYGLQPFEPPAVPLTRVADRGLSLFETFEVGDVHQFWSAVAPAFNDFITGRSIVQETATA